MSTTQGLPMTTIIEQLLSFITANIWSIVLIIFILVFRIPLSDLLKRIISLNFSFGSSKGKIQATTPEKLRERDGIETKPTIESKKYKKLENKPEELEERESESDDWFSKMNQAFSDKEYEKAEEIFEDYIKTENEKNKKLMYECHYRYMAYTKAGDGSAIDRFQRLIETTHDESLRDMPIFWLSESYKFTKNFNKAVKLWRSSIEQATSDIFKTDCTAIPA